MCEKIWFCLLLGYGAAAASYIDLSSVDGVEIAIGMPDIPENPPAYCVVPSGYALCHCWSAYHASSFGEDVMVCVGGVPIVAFTAAVGQQGTR